MGGGAPCAVRTDSTRKGSVDMVIPDPAGYWLQLSDDERDRLLDLDIGAWEWRVREAQSEAAREYLRPQEMADEEFRQARDRAYSAGLMRRGPEHWPPLDPVLMFPDRLRSTFYGDVTRRTPIAAAFQGRGLTYVVQRGSWVKIGQTTDLLRRVSGIRSLHPNRTDTPPGWDANDPARVELIAVLQGLEWEASLHERYAEHRVRGEWFDASPVLADLAEAMTRQTAVLWWP